MNKKLSPIIALVILIIIVALGSMGLSLIEFGANQTSIVEGKLETSIVLVNNIFTDQGIADFFSHILYNDVFIKPLILLIISLAATSILFSSGLLKHIISPLKKLRPSLITFLVVLISIMSTIIGDYGYIVLLPLIGVVYKYLNKNPILGVITVFIGMTLGYGTGIFYNYSDYALGMLTESAAVIEVAASYNYDLYSSIYIMLASSIAITFIITYLIEQNVSKKVTVSESYTDELVTSKKALIYTIITGVILFILVLLCFTPVFNNILLDNSTDIFVAKVFNEASPFNAGFMFIYLIISAICGFVYGIISKNFANNLEYSWGFTKAFNNIGYLCILLFLGSILVYIIEWTNLGIVITNTLLTFLSTLNIAGIPLIVVSFVLIILMGIFIPGTVEKWVIISPIMIPLFVRGNITPDFAQFIFEAADSVGKVLTPAFIFFPIMLGFVQSHNINHNKITLMGTVKLIWPIIIAMVVFWLLILIVWYVAGLPLGIETLTTL